MWPDGVKPRALCIWIEIPFVSSVDEKTRGLVDMCSTRW